MDSSKPNVDDRGKKKPAQSSNYNYGQLTFGKHKDSHYKISLRTFFGNPESEVFSIRFDNQDTYVAASNSDGSIKVFNLDSGKLAYNLSGYTTSQQTPTTCLRWKPNSAGHLMSANADGSIMDWGMKKGQSMARVLNPCGVFGIDYNNSGSKFVAVGKDFHVRVYDDEKKVVEIDFGEAENDRMGHSNRVFAVKHHPDEPTLFLTSGWDSVINIWDTRDRRCVGHFENVTVSGDSIDIQNNQVLAGCYRNQDQLMLFDFRTRELLQKIKWDGDEPNDKVYCYSAAFSKHTPGTFIATSNGVNECKIFDLNDNCKPCASVVGVREGIYAADYSHKSDRFAFAGGEGVVYIMGQTDLNKQD